MLSILTALLQTVDPPRVPEFKLFDTGRLTVIAGYTKTKKYRPATDHQKYGGMILNALTLGGVSATLLATRDNPQSYAGFPGLPAGYWICDFQLQPTQHESCCTKRFDFFSSL